MKPLLQVDNLHVRFHTQEQEIHAVQGIDFFVQAGEVLGIVGESGCGKSATVKSILKLFSPHSATLKGNIIYNGHNIAAYTERQMQTIRGKEIALIFQQSLSVLNPTQKVGQQILEGLFLHQKTLSKSEGKSIALQLLNDVGFSNPEDIMEAYPHILSGGMRQRVVIALALICEPKVLLADEPTSSLDAALQSRILSLLKQKQQLKKMSIVLITHDIHIAAQFCDRLMIMYAGKVVESGPVEAILHRPQHPYTQMLFHAIPRLDQPKNERLMSIEGTPPNLHVPFDHCTFCSRCPDAMTICAEATPLLYSIEGQHLSACFKQDKRHKNDSIN